MKEKIIAVFTGSCFLLSSWSCSLSKKVTLTPEAIASKKNVAGIVTVWKTSGEKIEFNGSGLGKLSGGEIVGLSGRKEQVGIPKGSGIGLLRLPGEQAVYTEGQREFVLLRKVGEAQAAVFYERIPRVHVPLAEIERVILKKKDGVASAFASLGLIAGVIGVVVAVALADIMSGPWLHLKW